MEYIKLQLGCFIAVLFIGVLYLKSRIKNKDVNKVKLFDVVMILAATSLIFDGITAYMVNHLDTINIVLNKICHMFFLLSLDGIIFIMFIYMLYSTDCFPKRKITKAILFVPFVICMIIVISFIHQLDFKVGKISNYSMGISAYTCYIMVIVYTLLTIFTFIKRWRYIESGKRISVATYLSTLTIVAIIQMIFPDALVTSIVVFILVLGIYINQEAPAIKNLKKYHSEMVHGFATLVENKDSNTGGHIKRTSLYVRLLAEELRNRGYYTNVLTKDYLNNLEKAAPMHDIGKIAIPDIVLQKPGRLTTDEFEVIKSHSVKGGEIIQSTFGHLDDKEYLDVSYNIAMYHHEKWNGTGYPEGLKGDEIPLCARIMAIADVFDAVSEKRCYRDAMPLDECFKIIENGRGKDFEPLMVDVFLSMKREIVKIYNNNHNEE